MIRVLVVLNLLALSGADVVKLDGAIRPIVYDLKLTLSSSLETISGQVEIELHCVHDTSVITLNANTSFIKVHHGILDDRFSNTSTSLELPSINEINMTISFALENALKSGHVYYLSLWFTTRYSMVMLNGFTQTPDAERGTWMNSVFETSFAREMLPCFDEPRFRSIFRLQLWLHNEFAADSFVALSNTNGVKETWSETLTIWTFEPTPPIPSYLFTMAVGKFKSFCRTPKILTNREICIWRFASVNGWETMAEIIIERMAQFYQSMLDYLLIEPIERLHLLVVPLKVNGMENYGLLNMREHLWPQENDPASLTKFEKTLFHEMVHQWFGNLVTLSWWSDIWLSESITSFLSALEHPVKFDTTMDLTTMPLVSNRWAKGIPMFCYKKGAVIVQMLSDVIGAERFQRLLRHHARVHQLGVASTQDFLMLLKRVTKDMKADIVEFLTVWLYQGSYPIVFIDYDQSQRRFVLTQTPKVGTPKARWSIPIWTECTTGKQKEQLHWIPRNGQLILDLDQLTSMNSSSAVIFNKKRGVYYQISYRY